MTEKKPYVEIKVDRKGFSNTIVKIDGREVYVSALKFDLDGSGLPRVQLTICDEASLSVACEADVTVVDATLSRSAASRIRAAILQDADVKE